MAFTEFYCQNGGSNLNAGSTTNNTAAYTSNGGNWANSTRVFTVTDGTNPSASVNVGDFASVYVTAGATVTGFMARVTIVQNATNGTITLSSTVSAGANPSNGTGTMTIKVGGAWKGPNAAVTFPLSVALTALVNTNGDPPRVNFKNDATYSMTSTLAANANTGLVIQGYSSSPGDGGKATLDGGTNAIILFSNYSGDVTDFIFSNNGTTGTNQLINIGSGAGTFLRCVFHDSRGALVTSGSSIAAFKECEFYAWNKANSSTQSVRGAITTITTLIADCYFHDATGSNCSAYSPTLTTNTIFLRSTFDTIGGPAIEVIGNIGSSFTIDSCNFYNITGSAIKNISNATNLLRIDVQNSNFIKGGAYGIDNNGVAAHGWISNNGYGRGTQANSSGDTHSLSGIIESGAIAYANDVTPWNSPTTGDFTTVLPTAFNAGRFHYEQNDGTNTGTVGYPDIGASQHRDTQKGFAYSG